MSSEMNRVTSSTSVTLERDERAECHASSALAWTLRLSRLCAAAPVTLERRDHVFMRASILIYRVHCVFMIVLCTMCVVGVWLNFFNESEILTANTSSGRLIWLTNIILVLVTAITIFYDSFTRVKEVIGCLSRVQKIRRALTGRVAKELQSEKKKMALVVFFVLYFIVNETLEYIQLFAQIYRFEPAERSLPVLLVVLFGWYVVAGLIIISAELQFALIVLEISEVLSELNDQLEQMMMRPNIQTVSSNLHLFKTYECTSHLGSFYPVICDVIKRVDKAYATCNISILATCLLHLIITPYFFIDAVITTPDSIMETVVPGSWTVLHVLRTLLIIEPPHMTLNEIERTYGLVCTQILHSTNVMVSEELKQFYKYLLLNRTEYAPLGLFTIRRSLMVTMLASIATYLAIITQFKQ